MLSHLCRIRVLRFPLKSYSFAFTTELNSTWIVRSMQCYYSCAFRGKKRDISSQIGTVMQLSWLWSETSHSFEWSSLILPYSQKWTKTFCKMWIFNFTADHLDSLTAVVRLFGLNIDIGDAFLFILAHILTRLNSFEPHFIVYRYPFEREWWKPTVCRKAISSVGGQRSRYKPKTTSNKTSLKITK